MVRDSRTEAHDSRAVAEAAMPAGDGGGGRDPSQDSAACRPGPLGLLGSDEAMRLTPSQQAALAAALVQRGAGGAGPGGWVPPGLAENGVSPGAASPAQLGGDEAAGFGQAPGLEFASDRPRMMPSQLSHLLLQGLQPVATAADGTSALPSCPPTTAPLAGNSQTVRTSPEPAPGSTLLDSRARLSLRPPAEPCAAHPSPGRPSRRCSPLRPQAAGCGHSIRYRLMLALASDVASGLLHLHTHGVVHG
jgi:hypothetical protein